MKKVDLFVTNPREVLAATAHHANNFADILEWRLVIG